MRKIVLRQHLLMGMMLIAFSLAALHALPSRATPATAQVEIRLASVAPTIDGGMDSVWESAAVNPIGNLIAGSPVAAADFSGSFRALYSPQQLYILVEVLDKERQNDSGANWWEDDGIELYINGDGSAGTQYDGANDFQLGFRWGDNTVHAGANSLPVPAGIQVSSVDTSNGYRLEVAIPLAGVSITPPVAAGNTLFGVEVELNEDDDGGGREQKLAWNATVDDAWQNPSLFGRAKLLGAAATPTLTPTPNPNPNPWQPAGFGGAGAFISLHFDRTQPGVVYATSDVGGVYHSSDFGQHWQMRSVGLGNYEVSSLAIDPFDANRLYAGVGAFANSDKAGLYVSHNAGVSWQHLKNTASNHIDFRVHRTVNAIAPDPAQQGVLLTGSRSNGIWRSTDEGANWSQVLATSQTDAPPFFSSSGGGIVDPESVPYPAPVEVIRFDPSNANIVYAALYGVGVFKSNNRGVAGSWQPVNKGLPGKATLHDLAVGANGLLYAAVGRSGVYKSTDGGNTWQAANGGIPIADLIVLSLAMHPTDPNTLWLSQEHIPNPQNYHPAVWKTSNGGGNWTAISQNVATDPTHSPPDLWWFYPTSSWRVVVDPLNANRLFFLNGGIYASEDEGANWQNRIQAAQVVCVTDLAVDGNRLYATHLDAGLLASDDNGDTWRALSPVSEAERDPLAGHYWRIVMTQVGGVKRFYTTASPWAHSHTQILRSGDGVQWQAILTRNEPSGGRGLGMNVLAADPSQPATLYFAQDGGVILKSTNHGDSWQQTATQPNATRYNDLLVDEAGRLFVASEWQGLWRSSNGGASWTQVLTERFRFGRMARGSAALYVPADDGNLYRSQDGGNTWQNLTNLPAEPDSDESGILGMAVAVNPSDANHLLFARYDGWHSADMGAGVLESRDGGQRWQPINQGLTYPRVSVLAFGRNGVRFAGTMCGGVWATTGNDPSSTATPTPTARLFLPSVKRGSGN